MKATATAPSNIAFIKYWGKTNPKTRIPENSSISMNLSEMYTTTTVEFDASLIKDDIAFINETTVKEKEKARAVDALDKIRKKTKSRFFAKVRTQNTFPKATGIASSASGFASLAAASFAALDYMVNERELSLFCRILSGTACRSVPSGIVEWKRGTNTENSYGHSLYPPDYWDICDVIAIVTSNMKKVSSTDGHAIADTSPFYEERIGKISKKIEKIKRAMQKKDFSLFGKILEEDTLNMHAICLTSSPSLIYWVPTTIKIMNKVISWREKNEVEGYFTIDAGPTVHVICQKKDAEKLKQKLDLISGIERVVINHPARGARVVNSHLF